MQIALNTEQELQLKVRDVEGLFFVKDDADIMNVQLNASSNVLVITRYFAFFLLYSIFLPKKVFFFLDSYATYILIDATYRLKCKFLKALLHD